MLSALSYDPWQVQFQSFASASKPLPNLKFDLGRANPAPNWFKAKSGATFQRCSVRDYTALRRRNATTLAPVAPKPNMAQVEGSGTATEASARMSPPVTPARRAEGLPALFRAGGVNSDVKTTFVRSKRAGAVPF